MCRNGPRLNRKRYNDERGTNVPARNAARAAPVLAIRFEVDEDPPFFR